MKLHRHGFLCVMQRIISSFDAMDDLVEKDVKLVQDLLDLGVISVSIDRVAALLHEEDPDLNCEAEVLTRRRPLLENLSVKLTGPLLACFRAYVDYMVDRSS